VGPGGVVLPQALRSNAMAASQRPLLDIISPINPRFDSRLCHSPRPQAESG
jgi:hypothetical protein